jgi:hypothetical protein
LHCHVCTVALRACDIRLLKISCLGFSGFRKEELKVLYNTSRKLKVAGERPVDGGASARWARFLKSFPVPKSVNTGGIKAVMDKDKAVLYVILPKGSPSSSTNRQKQKEQQQQPGSSLPLPHGEQKAGTGNAEGSSGSSSGGSFWSAQEDVEKNRTEESNVAPDEIKVTIQEEIATQDAPRTDGSADANAMEKDGDDDDDEGENKRWWQKIRPLHVLGFVVLILALVGVGALCVLL